MVAVVMGGRWERSEREEAKERDRARIDSGSKPAITASCAGAS
jgi:hypothetical protein